MIREAAAEFVQAQRRLGQAAVLVLGSEQFENGRAVVTQFGEAVQVVFRAGRPVVDKAQLQVSHR